MDTQLPSEPKTKSTFRLPKSLYTRLKIRAIHEGRPVADLLADAAELYLTQEHANHQDSTRATR